MKILRPPTLMATLLALPAASSRPPPTRMEGDRAGPPTTPAQPR